MIKKISKCESLIEDLENELNGLTKQLESPDSSSQDSENNALFIKYGELKKTMDQKMHEWEKLHDEFEVLKKSSQNR